MKNLFWITPIYALAVVYPAQELTRYIMAWAAENGGNFPLGSGFHHPWQEILWIWTSYIVGVILVGVLSREVKIK